MIRYVQGSFSTVSPASALHMAWRRGSGLPRADSGSVVLLGFSVPSAEIPTNCALPDLISMTSAPSNPLGRCLSRYDAIDFASRLRCFASVMAPVPRSAGILCSEVAKRTSARSSRLSPQSEPGPPVSKRSK